MPSCLSERIVSQALRRAAGSNPVVGSSRKISSGSPDQRERQVQAAQLTAGERAGHRVLLALQAGERDHLVDVAGMGVHGGEMDERLAHLDVAVQAGALEHDPDAGAQRARALPGSNPSTLTSPSVRSR